MQQEQKNFLDRNSDRILARISVEEITEARKLISDFVDEIVAMQSGEEKSRALDARFGTSQNCVLHLAAKFGDELVVKKILNEAKNDQYVNVKNDDGFTPLHFAATNGSIAVDQVLIAAGADVNAQASEKKRRWTPIHYAAQFGHVEVIDALIKAGVSKEAKTGFGLTPLVVGAEFGHVKVVEFMLSLGADKNAQTIAENHKMTALHYAVIGNFVDVAIALLNAKIDKEREADFGLTALEFAAKNNLSEMVVLLMNYGADKWNDALKIAQENKCEDVVKQIKKYQKVKASLFSGAGLDKETSSLIAGVKQFNATNLGEMEIILEDGVAFNAYGILSLTQPFGLFKKVEKKLVDFVDENGSAELASALKRLGVMVG
ncbi:MAG: ankyrin repeat domain-containing protein [Rickettsiales bacterium]|nr:ankyrin repeat domain-containing protein [Rickettsiales bacterium]